MPTLRTLALLALLAAPLASGCGHTEPTPASSSTTSAQTNGDTNATGSCTRDADCHVESDYCGGCNCRALGANDSAPRCESPVQCFADPCMGKTAACVDGACVAR